MYYLLGTIILLMLAYIVTLHREINGYEKRIEKMKSEFSEYVKKYQCLERSVTQYHESLSEIIQRYRELLKPYN